MAISAQTINNLKARVKAECSKRALTTYAGTAYDYTVTPASGVIIKQEHRDKIAIPLNAINSNVIKVASGQTVVSEGDITSLDAFTTTLEKREKTDHSASDCKSSCTGLCFGCVGTCYDACTSCTSCSGCTGCTSCTSCSGCTGCSGCGSGCSGSCYTMCSGTCKGGCSSCTGCGYNCSSTCMGECTGDF